MITGKLSERPLPSVLEELFKERFTGELVINGEGGLSRIYLREGYSVFVDQAVRTDLLGEVLLRTHVIDELEHKRSLATLPHPGERYGDVLLGLGLCDERVLKQALKEQVRVRIQRLYAMSDGGFAAIPSEHGHGLQHGESLGIAPPPVPAPGSVLPPPSRPQGASRPVVPQETGLDGGQSRRLLSDSRLQAARERRARRELGPEAFKEALKETRPKEEPRIEASAEPAPVPRPEPPRETRPKEGSGREIRLELEKKPRSEVNPEKEPEPGEKPLAEPARSEPLARKLTAARPKSQGGPPEDVTLLSVEVQRRGEVLEEEDYFSMLGVSEGADVAAIREAYAAATKRYNPQRLTTMGLGHLVLTAQKLIEKLALARSVLSDPKKREEYVAELRKEEATNYPRWHDKRLKVKMAYAEIAFARGQPLLKRRDFAGAAKEFEEALRLNPNKAQHVAYSAWARFCAGQMTAQDALKEAIKGSRMGPKQARLHYFVGILYKQTEQLDRAMIAFHKALELDKTLTEADSEIRLLQARGVRLATNWKQWEEGIGKASAPKSQSAEDQKGLFDKLLRRK